MDREYFIRAATRLQAAVGHHRGRVLFNRNEYDYQEDFPHILLAGRRVDICEVRMDSRSDDIVLVADGGSPYLSLVISKGVYDPEQDAGIDPESLYCLMQDVFYSLPESFNHDDFESFVDGRG